MIKIHCEKYHCSMQPEACASRFLNSQGSGQSPVGNHHCGMGDPGCIGCQDGAMRLKALGKERVLEYRKELGAIKKRVARFNQMPDWVNKYA